MPNSITTPLEAFTFLSDHIPTHLSTTSTLRDYASQRHAVFAAEYTKLVDARKAAHRRPRKTSSTHSVRTKDQSQSQQDDNGSTKAVSRQDSLAVNTLDPLNSKYIYGAARKRKVTAGNGPSVRSGASGPAKYRTRHMVIVYYDGYVQEQFGELVKGISSARHALRKGKMELALRSVMNSTTPSMLKTTSTGSDEDGNTPETDGDEEDFRFVSMTGYRSARNGRPIRSTILMKEGANGSSNGSVSPGHDQNKSTDTISAIEKADKYLEIAQGLCELGAHQFLRDGDCTVELQGVAERFEAALNISTEQMAVLHKEAEEERAKKEAEEARKEKSKIEESETKARDGPGTNGEPMEIEKVPLEDAKHVDLNHSNGDAGDYPTGPGMTMEIEVDDDDASSVEIDLSAFKTMRRR